jgi:hypothetical protein
MLKSVLTTGAILFLGIATATAQTTGTTSGATGAAQQMSSAECQALWNKAAGGQAGQSLSRDKAQAYVTDFDKADTAGDGSLSNAEFMAACQQGLVRDTAGTGAGTGTTGQTGTGTTGTGATGTGTGATGGGATGSSPGSGSGTR